MFLVGASSAKRYPSKLKLNVWNYVSMMHIHQILYGNDGMQVNRLGFSINVYPHEMNTLTRPRLTM